MNVRLDSLEVVVFPDGRTTLPRAFTALPSIDGVKVEVRLETDDWGQPRCTSVKFEADPASRSLSSDHLRLPLARIIKEARKTASYAVFAGDIDNGKGGTSQVFEPFSDDDAAVHKSRAASTSGGPRKNASVNDEHLKMVRDEYRLIVKKASTYAPTEALALKLNVSRSTAARWVSQARERGLLGRATPGKAGEAESP